LSTTIYLDNNATTAIAPEVVDAMMPFLKGLYFNPSSMYEPAHEVADALKKAKRTIARFLGVGNIMQILPTSCATEANTTAIVGAARANPGRRHVITTKVEHPAVLEVCRDLERQGYEVTWLDVDKDGRLNIRDLIRALRPDTLLVSIMHANNETGVIFPVDELARVTKETEPSILFHTDATQTVGKLPVNLKGSFKNVDMLSFSGHKLHAPKGVGALFVRRGTPMRPLLIGGHQEDGRRAGTENVAYIVGLAKACELAIEHREGEERVRALRDRLENTLMEKIPYLEVNGRAAPRLPNTTNVAVHFVEGEGILYQLSESGICASSGSACTSGSLEPSHVLRAMDVPFTAVHGSVRFSLSRYTTEDEIDKVIEVFPQIIDNLRKLSPYWDYANKQPSCPIESIV
jgi:cysteine desulfurase